MFNFFKKIFDSNEKQLKKANMVVEQINLLESEVKKLSFEDIREEVEKMQNELKLLVDKVPEDEKSSIKSRDIEKGLPSYELDILKKLQEFTPRIYSFIREIANRKLERRHFDVQLLSGVVLSWGNKLVEVKTGEGKTQIFHLPLGLYALTGRGSHLVTVNDYLAKRDGEYAGHVLSELGLSVGIVVPQKSYKFIKDDEIAKLKGEEADKERKSTIIKNPGDVKGLNLVECTKKEAYACDVVYGTNNEFGFDYLRDNMASKLEDISQRELYFCFVDEVDSILIDEARTPLIISAAESKSTDLYQKFASLIPRLTENEDYTVDEKSHSSVLTDKGIVKMENLLGVKNIWEDFRLAHHLDNALKAYTLYKKDDEYIVKDGQVLIVDEFTGRVLAGRRYSEGLHQAIEAKEGVEIKKESKTLATITFQNFFRLYKVLGGGSGTVMTEAEEFFKIYKLDSVEIPTNKEVIRIDAPDRIYKNKEAKFQAVVNDIKVQHEKGQPILVGTASIENSEDLSKMLDKEGIPHEVLNARHHEREAHIIEKAGMKGAVTVATNMAGRGTDIKLEEGVNKLGGLYVLGTERHEARRIDNQLRGRSGRQGDPGLSRFYVALDDEIMRIQGGDTIRAFMEKTNIPDDMPIENRIISGAIERSQKRMEGHHFDIRNNVVKYDDVMNQQREVFYLRRRNLLDLFYQFNKSSDDIKKTEKIKKKIEKYFKTEIYNEVSNIVRSNYNSSEKIEMDSIINASLDFAEDERILISVKEYSKKNKLKINFNLDIKSILKELFKNKQIDEIEEILNSILDILWINLEKEFPAGHFLQVNKLVFLQAMDNMWTEHLNAISDLREGIGLRGIAQRDPLVEYKNEAFNYFELLIDSIRNHYAKRIFKVKRVEQQTPTALKTNKSQVEDVLTGTREMTSVVKKFLQTQTQKSTSSNFKPQTVKNDAKIGRNDPCPCGSGKKYKKCCGKNQ